MKPKNDKEVRIIYQRTGFESKVGHQVRSRMEEAVCEWLMRHRIAHRHGSEVFTVRMGVSGSPTAYVPDIILHDKDETGRTIIIEPFDAYSPKVGSTRIMSLFRKEMKNEYYVIVIARKQHLTKVLKDAYDVAVCFDDIDSLIGKIPEAKD